MFYKLLVLCFLFSTSYSESFAFEQRDLLPIKSCVKHTSGINFSSGDKKNLTQVCQEGYLVFFDSKNHLPKVVFYNINADHAVGCFLRSDDFDTNKFVTGSAKPEDYKLSGFDKGHMAPDADMSWSLQVEQESFLMTNVAPQAPTLNRGIWKTLETQIRSHILLTQQTYIVIAGAVYDEKDITLASQVKVPHAYYKILVNLDTREFQVWYFQHKNPYYSLNGRLTQYRVPLLVLIMDAKISFKFPTGYKEVALDKELRYDYKYLTDSKKEECGL